MAGGHPRESLEASFDVVQEDHRVCREITSETLLVASQVIAILSPSASASNLPFSSLSPMWYIRLGHTRLSDSILELCGVPQKDALRRTCHRMLTRFMAPPPSELYPPKKRSAKATAKDHARLLSALEDTLNDATDNHGLPVVAANNLRRLIEQGLPLSCNALDAITSLAKAISKIKSTSGFDGDPRRLKRFEEAAKNLGAIKEVILILEKVLGLLNGSKSQHSPYHRPLYVSIDLGLRQRRTHYHGGIIYQCIALPDSFFDTKVEDETNDILLSQTGRGTKIAEGGEYSELVRRYRPPGNFATALVNYYTTAPVPMCCGVRFFVGKIVELAYLKAALDSPDGDNTEKWLGLDRSSLDIHGVDALRKTLGHPLVYASSVQCIVASSQGMDLASVSERFLVASRLWAEGITAEYIPHSGVMLSLLKRIRDDTEDENSSDWSLVELQGVCALLSIPFVIIVQPHLLRDKGSVRLRRVALDFFPNSSVASGGNEVFVHLDDLASTIVSGFGAAEETLDTVTDQGHGPSSTVHDSPIAECIYVESDAYYGNDREVSKNETPQWRSVLKSIKKVELATESFLKKLGHEGTSGIPVFAVDDVSFWALRDFGTFLMQHESDQSAVPAYSDTAARYPKHKRSLKTLATAIDNYLRRSGTWGNRESKGRKEKESPRSCKLLLYSKLDDRFDFVTIDPSHAKGSSRSNGHGEKGR